MNLKFLFSLHIPHSFSLSAAQMNKRSVCAIKHLRFNRLHFITPAMGMNQKAFMRLCFNLRFKQQKHLIKYVTLTIIATAQFHNPLRVMY